MPLTHRRVYHVQFDLYLPDEWAVNMAVDDIMTDLHKQYDPDIRGIAVSTDSGYYCQSWEPITITHGEEEEEKEKKKS